MRTSVIIPCVPKDVGNVVEICKTYLSDDALTKPDEIVVSLSTMGDCGDLGELRELATVVGSEGVLLHGPNRNVGTEASTGDLLFYQDSDDMPALDRVKRGLDYFDLFEIDHLNHSYYTQHRPRSSNDGLVHPDHMKRIYFPTHRLEECKVFRCYGEPFGTCHAGVPITKREVWETIKWKEPKDYTLGQIEDYEFCMEAAFLFRAMQTQEELYKYIEK